MIEFGKRSLVNGIIAAVILIAAAYLGVTESLGAHPFWSVKIAYIGVVIGVVIYAFSWVWQGSWLSKFIAFFALLVIAAGATYWGKTQFAASYAENVLAGRFWYFGWIAIAAALFSMLIHVLNLRR